MKRIKLHADGTFHPLDGEKKSIVVEGVEHILPDDLWHFMLCLESEREYFRKKYMELTGAYREKLLTN